MIVPAYYEDLHTHHLGTTPNRAYFIPASVRMDDLIEHREHSDRFQLLNGDWKFKYCESIHDFEDLFYEQGFDAGSWDTIPVPSVWQNHGYDQHQYTNIRYPFPVDPPYVPVDNPCGAYLCDFVYVSDEDAPKAYLNFEGVDSCFYVWLNGKYVGYSQVSHSTSEFDVSELIEEGSNTLAVLVLKWCDGSYLEDQDKFRTSGIFRDVYLLKRPESCIRDYFTTMLVGKEASVNIRIAYNGDAAVTKLKLLDAENRMVAVAAAKPFVGGAYTHQAVLHVENPILWNPEQPYLYTLVIETPGETITDRVGLREVSIENNQVFLNGSPFKFRGVNRHDSDPVTGPVISVEHMKRDLRMIKEHNFNAIRTSHYPNAPMFYQLCDQYGFLVIDEADNESHGASATYCKDNDTWENHVEIWNEPFADNPDFLEATVDRARCCVQRDKNRPSVICWSMGNESAYGCCFEAALAWTKHFDPARLTHYESAQYRRRKRKYDFSNIDLYSNMYPSLETLQNYIDNDPDKPYLMCEYSHAMGNGPGDLEDYWQFIQANEIMSGGFVWEWCDHAVYAGEAENGKVKYLYGGDHGEFPHDGNFCVDGLVYPDRRPHTGLLEYKNIHRPVRVVSYDEKSGQMILHNYMDFVSLSDYLTISYELNCDGEIVSSGRIEKLPAVAPHCDGTVQLALDIPEKGRCYLKVNYLLKNATELLGEGFELGFDEIELNNADKRNQTALQIWKTKSCSVDSISVVENDRYLTIGAPTFCYEYDKRTGMFTKLNFRGEELIDRPVNFNIWCAPTDNDRKLKLHWMAAYYDHAVTRAYSTHYVAAESEVRIHSDVSIAGISVQKIMDIDLDWTVSVTGEITVDVLAKRNMEFPELPRFGLRLFLPKALEKLSYYGLGPVENYMDKRHAAYHSLFHTTVSDLHEDYIRPQENGAHGDCDYAVLESDKLRLTVVSTEGFSFNASHYTQEELTEKGHSFELEECDSTVLCLDYRHNGIGSESCGPRLIEKYRLDDETIDFSIRLIPEAK
ncbi:MAG: DUF4981 domain-containing protein [Oscillospiraceae bacterium]|nr:DUF4981 domain-containing protein [Oscillospiraceae bacterium]